MKQIKALVILLTLISFCSVNILSVQASGLIFVRADGSLEGTNKIQRNGNVYTFIGDIKESYGIIVETKNIVIDGKGHTLEGTPRILPIGSWDFGIELTNITSGHVTIKDLKILNFNIGIYVGTANNTITGNTISGGNVGITIAESPNIIIGNHIENNLEGVFLGPLPHDHANVHNIFYHNSFVNNTRHVYDCECTNPIWIQHLNVWDNGTSGNYWSDYDGIDVDKDGIGDTPYSVTEDDVDTCPLMEPLAYPLGGKDGFLGTNIPLEVGLAIIAGAIIAISTTAYVVFKRKKSKA
ncbi:MAG: hypothetical protein JSW14_02000 [Candidatus Bathyarchaeum sp.]|nr:MAG: hypothetical protein JSW14_02000 [Candidatus Bathyarchaeum sp.]